MKKLSILFAAFSVLFLVSCGKYEDGPGFSLRSKEARLAGTWTFEKVTWDGIDVAVVYEDTHGILQNQVRLPKQKSILDRFILMLERGR